MQFLSFVSTYKGALILLLSPILLSPLLFLGSQPAKGMFCMLLMASYWVSDVVPMGVTALIPLFAFPILHILPSSEVCQAYLPDTNFLFIGGLIVAIAVEESKLHERIALKVLTVVGSQPQWLMLGLMAITAFLSMWISNTATTAMMTPIAVQVIIELIKFGRSSTAQNGADGSHEKLLNSHGKQHMTIAIDAREKKSNTNFVPRLNLYLGICLYSKPYSDQKSRAVEKEGKSSANPAELDPKKMNPSERNIAIALMICICVSSNIGGTATVTGTGPNIIMVGQLNDNLYKGKSTGLNFATWMAFAAPPAIVCLIGSWLCLVVHFLGFKTLISMFKRDKQLTSNTRGVAELLREKYKLLPPLSFAEISAMVAFGALLILWVSRAPGGKGSGFEALFNYDYKDGNRVHANFYTDATSAMLIAFLLFCLPNEKPDFMCTSGRDKSQAPKKRGSLVDWPTMQAKFPWGLVLLIGGGFALGEGVQSSGLSHLIGAQLQQIGKLPLVLVQAVCILLAMSITAVMTPVSVSILIPIVHGLTEEVSLNPLAVIFPTTLACSFAFTLPVSTPPNAIVFSYGILRMSDMIKAGLLVSIVCGITLIVFLNSYCLLIFDLHTKPDWAFSSEISTVLTNFTSTVTNAVFNGTF